MALGRKPFQGIGNIVYFNWPWYAYFLLGLGLAFLSAPYLPEHIQPILFGLLFLICLSVLASLLVSYWIYDRTDLYDFPLIQDLNHKEVLQIHAGFDESSRILRAKYPQTELQTADFYDAARHHEPSIKRARKRYPASKNCLQILTTDLPYPSQSFDKVLLIFSAHEIRSTEERIQFFQELRRILKDKGEIIIMEHRRDWRNFLVYQLGFLHFYSRKQWLSVFRKANLSLKTETQQYLLISTFNLTKDGTQP